MVRLLSPKKHLLKCNNSFTFTKSSFRFDKLLNEQTEMDENLNITIPKTNLAAIYKLTDGHLTPSPVKNRSRVPPSGGTSPNSPNKG